MNSVPVPVPEFTAKEVQTHPRVNPRVNPLVSSIEHATQTTRHLTSKLHYTITLKPLTFTPHHPLHSFSPLLTRNPLSPPSTLIYYSDGNKTLGAMLVFENWEDADLAGELEQYLSDTPLSLNQPAGLHYPPDLRHPHAR